MANVFVGKVTFEFRSEDQAAIELALTRLKIALDNAAQDLPFGVEPVKQELLLNKKLEYGWPRI